MRVTISSSSRDEIDQIYKDEAIKVCEYLASNGWDLNWGSGSSGLMGICYDVFNKYNRNIYGYVTQKYFYDIENLPNATHTKYPDTLALKRDFFLDADLYICLPGGLGSISEVIAYIEEARSNDSTTPIIMYNIDHHFDSTVALFDDLIKRHFNNESLHSYYKVVNNVDELKEIIEK